MNRLIIKSSVGLGMLEHCISTTRKSSTFAWPKQKASVADRTDVYRSLNSLDFIIVLLYILNLSVGLEWTEI
jgi:hypothetical protein